MPPMPSSLPTAPWFTNLCNLSLTSRHWHLLPLHRPVPSSLARLGWCSSRNCDAAQNRRAERWHRTRPGDRNGWRQKHPSGCPDRDQYRGYAEPVDGRAPEPRARDAVAHPRHRDLGVGICACPVGAKPGVGCFAAFCRCRGGTRRLPSGYADGSRTLLRRAPAAGRSTRNVRRNDRRRRVDRHRTCLYGLGHRDGCGVPRGARRRRAASCWAASPARDRSGRYCLRRLDKHCWSRSGGAPRFSASLRSCSRCCRPRGSPEMSTR